MRVGYGVSALVGASVMAVALTASADDARRDDHTAATRAVEHIKQAIAEILKAEDATSSGPAEYKQAARRALEALQGGDTAKRANPGEPSGAIDEIEHLLDRREDRPWEPVLEGTLANIRAAVGHLTDAGDARSLSAFDSAASQALENLEVALGRGSEYGVLGGMFGALANTELAVPPTARLLDGCSTPHEAGYGVYRGYLAYRAVPLHDAGQPIPAAGAQTIRMRGNMLVIYTAAAPLVQSQCTGGETVSPSHRASTLESDPR
jgi:polar amino acid transport system substrate-binding protein